MTQRIAAIVMISAILLETGYILKNSLPKATSQSSPFFASASSPAHVFEKDLRLRGRGQDIYELQKILNSDSFTAVAGSGPGSPGEETDYFGPLTRAAVFRFQLKYAAEILQSAGLSRPSGFVGAFTRRKLNSLSRELSEINNPSLAGSGNLLARAGSENGAPFVAYPNKVEVRRGEIFKISGWGFESGNTVNIGDVSIAGVPAKTSGTELHVAVPESMPFGTHNLFVENTKGPSNKGRFIVVVNPQKAKPTISGISPSSGAVGTIVNIEGKNFAAMNEVRASYGAKILAPSADGETLSFKVEYGPFAKLQSLKSAGRNVKNLKIPVYFWVLTDGGVSGQRGEFAIEIK